MRDLALAFVVCFATASNLYSNDVISVESVLLTVAEQAEVSAREVGTLSEVAVREGQKVGAGELLARLDDEEAKLACEHCKLELQRAQKLASNTVKVRLAKKELEIATAELKRASDAADRFSKSVTVAEFDRLKLDVERAVLQVEQAEFDLETARVLVGVQENELQTALERLRRRQLIAPIAGTVVSVEKHLGESVETGQVVVKLIATHRLRAECFLNVEQATSELTGRKVELSVRLPALAEQRFPGTLVFVNPEVDPVNGQIRVWAEIENKESRLRPGMAGSMKILPQ